MTLEMGREYGEYDARVGKWEEKQSRREQRKGELDKESEGKEKGRKRKRKSIQ